MQVINPHSFHLSQWSSWPGILSWTLSSRYHPLGHHQLNPGIYHLGQQSKHHIAQNRSSIHPTTFVCSTDAKGRSETSKVMRLYETSQTISSRWEWVKLIWETSPSGIRVDAKFMTSYLLRFGRCLVRAAKCPLPFQLCDNLLSSFIEVGKATVGDYWALKTSHIRCKCAFILFTCT